MSGWGVDVVADSPVTVPSPLPLAIISPRAWVGITQMYVTNVRFLFCLSVSRRFPRHPRYTDYVMPFMIQYLRNLHEKVEAVDARTKVCIVYVWLPVMSYICSWRKICVKR